MMFFFLPSVSRFLWPARSRRYGADRKKKDVVVVVDGGGAVTTGDTMLACCWLSLSAAQARKYYTHSRRDSISSKGKDRRRLGSLTQSDVLSLEPI